MEYMVREGLRDWPARRMPIEIFALILFCAILNLFFERSLAQGSIPAYTWLVLAAGDVVAIYPPFLLLAWTLFRIWNRFGLQEAHLCALVATILLDFIGRALLVYRIVSGFSNP